MEILHAMQKTSDTVEILMYLKQHIATSGPLIKTSADSVISDGTNYATVGMTNTILTIFELQSITIP